MMAKAFIFMRKKAVAYATDETIEQLAKDYEEAIKEAAEALKGKQLSEETKKKLSEAHKGKQLSEETRKKMSESRKGKHPSKETRNKMSEANKGKQLSEETKNKISEAYKGCHWYNNGKINIRAKECPDGFVPGIVK